MGVALLQSDIDRPAGGSGQGGGAAGGGVRRGQLIVRLGGNGLCLIIDGVASSVPGAVWLAW